MTLDTTIRGVEHRLRHAWESDTVRLVVLTVYYLAIIISLAVIHGTGQYTPPPFIYQEF
jgi:hypothetical protein